MTLALISLFRLRRTHHRPRRNIWDKYPFLQGDPGDRAGRGDLVDRRCQGVRAGPWDPWGLVDQRRRLCLHLRGVREGLGGQHLRGLRALQAEEVGFELVRRHLRVVHRYRLVRGVRVGRVVRVVLVGRQCLGVRECLDLRGLRVVQEDQVDLVGLVGMACMEVE